MKNEVIRSTVTNVPIRISASDRIGLRPYPASTISAMHFHDEIELLTVFGNGFCCTSGDSRYIANDGDILYISSRVPHATETLEDGTFTHMIQFSVQDFSDRSANISSYLYRFINIGDAPLIIFRHGTEENEDLRRYCDAICHETYSCVSGYESYIRAGVYSIIGFLYRQGFMRDPNTFFNFKTIDKIFPALTYMDENYNEQITLNDLSQLLSINPFYFCRLFKRATNSTFTEYLNFVRVCKSEKLINSGSLNISDISLDVGFSSVSYFNRVFKRFKGCSPSEYKKIRYAIQ